MPRLVGRPRLYVDPEQLEAQFARKKLRLRGAVGPIRLGDVDVAALRERLRMSQAQFAMRFGFPVATLRHWERGDRKPRGPALTLLHVIDHNPPVALRAIMKAKARAQLARMPELPRSSPGDPRR